MLKWFRKIAGEGEEKESAEAFEESGPGSPANDEPEENRVGFFKRLKERLVKTRETLVSRVDTLVLGKKEIDEDLLDELEEILITSDLGVETTQALIEKVQQKVKRKELDDPEEIEGLPAGGNP